MINKVILVGNVGGDPEIRTLESGVKVARVSLATTERMYNRQTQESKDHTEWHSVVFWRNMADTIDRFVKKGSKLYVEGRLRYRTWTDESGTKRYSVEIQADDVKLLDKREAGSAPQYPTQATQPAQPQPVAAAPQVDESIDDLPF